MNRKPTIKIVRLIEGELILLGLVILSVLSVYPPYNTPWGLVYFPFFKKSPGLIDAIAEEATFNAPLYFTTLGLVLVVVAVLVFVVDRLLLPRERETEMT